MFPALGSGPVKRAWLEEKEFQRCPWSVSSCVSNVQGSWAPFCYANGEGEGEWNTTEKMPQVWQILEASGKEEEEIKFDGEYSL